MTQLLSCSDTQTSMMSTPSAFSSEVGKRMVAVMNDTYAESSSSVSPYMNLCGTNLDYFDYMVNEQKRLGNQTADKHHRNQSNPLGCMTIGGCQPLNSLGENHHVCECLGNRQSVQQPSEMKYDLSDLNARVSPSEVGFVQPHEFASHLLEANNLIADSPCWKGTPVAYQPSFGNDTSHSVEGTDYNNSHQSQKLLELSSEFSRLFSKHQEASASENDPLKMFKLPVRRNNSEDHKVPPICVRAKNDIAIHASCLPEEQQARRQKCYEPGEDPKKSIIASKQESFCPLSKTTPLCEHTCRHTVSTTEESSKKVSSPIGGAPTVPVKSLTSENIPGSSQAAEAEESAHTQILTKEGEKHFDCYPDAEENILQMSDSSSRNQAIFLKIMHNLSVVLLSTCGGGSSLQEYEEELLKSVIQNLKAASSKRSKVKLKGDDCLRNSSQIKMENMSWLRNNFLVAMESTDSEFKTSVSQALTKLVEDKMLDDSEVSQVSIYKNLWIQAEASACKLKYELQLAHMKLATIEGHSNTQTVPEGEKASSLTVSSSKLHAKESSACAATLQCHRGDSGGSQSPMVNRVVTQQCTSVLAARVLSSPTLAPPPVPPPPALVPQPYLVVAGTPSGLHSDYCGKLGHTSQQCNKKKRDQGCKNGRSLLGSGSGSSLSGPLQSSSTEQELLTLHRRLLTPHARLTTLVSASAHGCGARSSGPTPPSPPPSSEPRIDNVNSSGENKCEEQQKESEGSYAVEDVDSARLRILNSCADNITSLGLESNKHQLDASTNRADEVDDAVMSRLRILKSHPDVEASSVGVVVDVEEDPCVVGLQVSNCLPPPSPAVVSEKTTLPSATEPLEVAGETPAILIWPTMEVPPLSTVKDAPSVMEKDHSDLADDALPLAPLLSVPQEAGSSAWKTAKVMRLSRGPTSKSVRLASKVKLKRPIGEQRAMGILYRKLGIIKKDEDEVDERTMDRCLEVLEASFPKSLITAILCGSDKVKGTLGEMWGISASDVVLRFSFACWWWNS